MPPPPPAYVPPPRPRRTGLVLFWPTLALIAIAPGHARDRRHQQRGLPSAYVALAVTITGVMLVIGAFVGRPGGLIALGLFGSASTRHHQRRGGLHQLGDRRSDPECQAHHRRSAVQDTYTVPNGQVFLDLTAVRDVAALDGRDISVHLNAGEIEVTLPRGVNAIVDADMSFAGDINIDGHPPARVRPVADPDRHRVDRPGRTDHHARPRRPRRPDHRRPALSPQTHPKENHHVRPDIRPATNPATASPSDRSLKVAHLVFGLLFLGAPRSGRWVTAA